MKLTFEAPPGILNNLERTYTQWKETGLNSDSTLQLQSLFVLAWLHAILQERRSFIPEAWLKFYEFSNADLRTAKIMIERVIAKNPGTPDWETVRGLMENAIYGGRIENMLDIGVLQAYLSKFFNNQIIAGGKTNLELAPKISPPALNNISKFKKFESFISVAPL